MGLVTTAQARSAAVDERIQKGLGVESILRESALFSRLSYDVFLSHSKMDSSLVLGAKRILELKGYTVYVDWVDDPQLDRNKVNRQTAEKLRTRMRSCQLMFYLHTSNASLSKWCPWELGYFDGYTYPNPRVFVFPLLAPGETSFQGQEYLKLYPIIDIDDVDKARIDQRDVWSYDPETSYRSMATILKEAR
ncbi:TIR domain-containing protein [Roseivivax sp. THAF197b]|uniref:TIR domain-containing protein n=1 Tax=Roseivivax sp. THAF197b TaxID=2588299 RepID=UPI001268D486|nr:hypothetical protein FIV09_20250 [Roseivivax sp. THAF197b]